MREINPYRGFRGVYSREWRRFMADRPQKMLLFAIAPLLAWLFCALYGNGTVADLPVAIVDNDNSSLSRTVIRAIDATKLMRVVAQVHSVEALQKGITSGAFTAGFVFPEHMMTDVKSSRQAYCQLVCNGTSYLTASLITREAQTVVKTMKAGIVKTRLTKSGLSENQAMALISPIIVDMSNCYNPTMSYSNFLSPGLLFAQLGTIIMLAGAICFARERERNTLARLRYRAKSSSFSALHGKSLPYALCILALCGVILFSLFPFYNVGTLYGTLRVLPGVVLFCTASWWLGALVGTITGQVLVAASFSVGIGMPSFLFSGWTFPLPAAPTLYSYIAAVLPFPHFMPIWFGAVEKGSGIASFLPELAVLLAMTLITHFLTRIMLKFFWNRAQHKGLHHV
jgi:ABC-2 type transport system permease protein